MIKVSNIDVWGFEHAVRGMRNPLNSWDKSDSEHQSWRMGNSFVIGKNDLDLMKRLYKAGSEHRKYLRQIIVSMDITAPLYWWKEFDTYKIGTVANSCSTMHKIAAKEFELDDFSWEQLLNTGCDLFTQVFGKGSFAREIQPLQLLTDFIIPSLNVCREKYLETKNKVFWWQLIQLLPSSYNQRITITMNYENAIMMIKQRTGHKLDEWNEFVKILKNLPYIVEITNDNQI
ncbi:MAG: hypothetical protein IKN54_00735 [Lachnospiraceae bacterium]|nr:hypothetical protein [Lachnospiraceae bacterium]